MMIVLVLILYNVESYLYKHRTTVFDYNEQLKMNIHSNS